MASSSSSSSALSSVVSCVDDSSSRVWHIGRPALLVLAFDSKGKRKASSGAFSWLQPDSGALLVSSAELVPTGAVIAVIACCVDDANSKGDAVKLPLKAVAELRERFPQAFLLVTSAHCQASAELRQLLISDYRVNMVDRGDDTRQVREALRRALAPYVSEQGGPYHCAYCQLGPMSEDDLWLHTPLYHINHSNAAAASFQCPLCPPGAKPPGRYMVHVHNMHGPPGRGEAPSEFRTRQPDLYAYALVVVRRPSDGRYLLVQEFAQEGFWLPGGGVDPSEDLAAAAERETLEEAGIRIKIMGVLRFEFSPGARYTRLRVIFYAEPLPGQEHQEKTLPDYESVGAVWVSPEQVGQSSKISFRGHEPRIWIDYLGRNGPIYPLSVLSGEHAWPKIEPLVRMSGSPA